MKNIVTFLNFVRGYEPREPIDLLGTVKKQLSLIEEYKYKATFLLQYDAFDKKEYQEIFLKENPLIEVGVWLELSKDVIETCGLKYRGRANYDWDYYLDVGNLLGYSNKEKELIIDEIFSKFKEIFGFYPTSVGAWIIDNYSLNYIYNKYKIKAAAICREQWGTDGISLFGGYYNQAYYPSKNNILCPSNIKKGIPVPTFRMLGCDPINQYDGQILFNGTDVFTLEPVYWFISKDEISKIGGHNKEWISWYFDNTFKHNYGHSFGFAQIGQENSFGFERMEVGLKEQYRQMKPLIDEEIVVPMKLSEAGEWFKNIFDKSPVSSQIALKNYNKENKSSIWFYCLNYRINLFSDEKGMRIRDFFLFDENYKSRYEDGKPILNHHATYDNLPIMNGLLWSDKPSLAGIYLMDKTGKNIIADKIDYVEENNISTTIIKYNQNEIIISLSENEIRIKSDEQISLNFKYYKLNEDEKIDIKTLTFYKRGFKYSLNLNIGVTKDNAIYSDNNLIVFSFK